MGIRVFPNSNFLEKFLEKESAYGSLRAAMSKQPTTCNVRIIFQIFSGYFVSKIEMKK